MKIKVSEAAGPVLNWMVAKALDLKAFPFVERDHGQAAHRPLARWVGIDVTPAGHRVFAPSVDWSQGGPIIERERIMLIPEPNGRLWTGCIGDTEADGKAVYAHTPLIAAMRCYVASKLGGEVEVPDELV